MIAIRRRALGSIRFDRRYRGASLGEDVDLSWALRSRGWRLAIATDAHVIHRRAPRPTLPVPHACHAGARPRASPHAPR